MIQRQIMPVPELNSYKDSRYILNDTIWKDKDIDFNVEILCAEGDKINISNCIFRNDLIIRLDHGISINDLYMYKVEVTGSLKIFGHSDGVILKNVSIDTCEVDVLEVIGIRTSIDIYETEINKLSMESNKFSK